MKINVSCWRSEDAQIDLLIDRSGLIQTFVTTYGVAQGKHSSVAQCEITMDELFS